jgi:hypothetical protein
MGDPIDGRSTDREKELRALVSRAEAHDTVADAFLAKSFTDRLVIVDLESGNQHVPRSLRELFEEHGCRGANEVYGRDGADGSAAGTFDGRERHQFVDIETRGDHQSYVVE